MKVTYSVLFCAALVAASLFPQAAEGQASRRANNTAVVSDYFYQVISDSGSADATAITREMELRFGAYNRLFRFDPYRLASPLAVRAFRTQAAYDEYVSARLGHTTPGAVYLHYNQRDRRELVIHRGSPEEAQALSYQGFIQFLRAFVPNPPAWIRDGFAHYFSTLHYDAQWEELVYEENLSWLELVKGLGTARPSLESILLSDSQAAPENFQALSWSLVSFFLNNGSSDYFRTLTGIFAALSETASARANGEAALRELRIWADLADLDRDYARYIATRKTFGEFIRDGQAAYAAGDLLGAELNFLGAADLQPQHYAPHYYLGLLAYEGENFAMAQGYYEMALQYGAEAALVYYALGLNAASAGRNADAINYLRQAAEASPSQYSERVEAFLQRLH